VERKSAVGDEMPLAAAQTAAAETAAAVYGYCLVFNLGGQVNINLL